MTKALIHDFSKEITCEIDDCHQVTVLREIFADENFRDLKVKLCEIIFRIFIFAISKEPTFELLLE